jgi:putative ATP-binding cassette transporter
MRWRIWLSGRLIDDWLGDFAYYRRQFFRNPNDNPDQRIQQDIDIFTTGVGGQPNNPAYGSGHTLLFGAVAAVLSVIAFGSILWRLSGALTLGGITLPRALFWIVIGYVLAATVIAFVIGRPLIRLSYLNELRNAGFRYALVRVRDASAAIGLYRGENTERRLLGGRLSEVMEPDGEPGDQPVAIRGAGAPAFRTRDLVRRRHPVGDRVRDDPQRAVVLPGGLRRVRELPRRGDPPRRARRGE